MLKLFFLTAVALMAGDLSGRWSGTMESNGARVPVFLNLDLHGQEPSGTLATGDRDRQVPIGNIQLRGDEITFEAHDNAGRTVQFHLRLQDGLVRGDSVVDGETSQVTFSPVARIRQYTVTGQNSAPVVIRRVDPAYLDVQGPVLLEVEIGKNGIPDHMRVARSRGLGVDEKAIEAVKQWRFKPAYRDGKPVPANATVEVDFRP